MSVKTCAVFIVGNLCTGFIVGYVFIYDVLMDFFLFTGRINQSWINLGFSNVTDSIILCFFTNVLS